MVWNNAKINLQRAVRRMSIDEDIVLEHYDTPGQRVGGRWVESMSATAAATASIQPASGESLEVIPAGERTGNEMEFWGLSEARPLKRADGKSPTIIRWKGERFKVVAYEDWWQHGRYWFALADKVDQ